MSRVALAGLAVLACSLGPSPVAADALLQLLLRSAENAMTKGDSDGAVVVLRKAAGCVSEATADESADLSDKKLSAAIVAAQDAAREGNPSLAMEHLVDALGCNAEARNQWSSYLDLKKHCFGVQR